MEDDLSLGSLRERANGIEDASIRQWHTAQFSMELQMLISCGPLAPDEKVSCVQESFLLLDNVDNGVPAILNGAF